MGHGLAIRPEGGTGRTIRGKRPNIFVPVDKGVRATMMVMDIGAYSDSIADPEHRDAVADVAVQLSLHGNIIRDLDASGPGRRRAGRPDIAVSVPGHHPQRMNGPEITVPAGVSADGRELTVQLSARPGFGRELRDLAGIITADQPASSRTDARAT
jgi:hypothetical protein